jgi:hypothetical protein
MQIRALTAPMPANNRSRVTNGKALFIGEQKIHSQSERSRRYRDLLDGYRADLGRPPNTIEDSYLRQAAALALQEETRTAALVAGERVPSEELTQLSSERRRILDRLGLGGGRAEHEGPSLEQLLRGDTT